MEYLKNPKICRLSQLSVPIPYPVYNGKLLHMAVEDLRAKGISPVYLLTNHTGFYERYSWEFFCTATGDGEAYLSRMYIHR